MTSNILVKDQLRIRWLEIACLHLAGSRPFAEKVKGASTVIVELITGCESPLRRDL